MCLVLLPVMSSRDDADDACPTCRPTGCATCVLACWAAGPPLYHTPLTLPPCLLAAAVPRLAMHRGDGCVHVSSSKRTRWHGSRLSASPWRQAGTGAPLRRVVETHRRRIATGSQVEE